MLWHGCTHIAGLYPIRNIPLDFLTYGANLIAEMGFSTLKLELSIAFNQDKYGYEAFGTPTTLVGLAQQKAFAYTFEDPRFDRYVLTCFSLVEYGNNPWAAEFSKANGDAQEEEFYNLAAHLAATYPTKEFILKNWEGDWQLLNGFNPSTAQPQQWRAAYLDYHRRRQRAVRRAMLDVSAGGVVKYAIECNRVLDEYGFRVHRDIIPVIKPDMVSLSCYEAIEGWTEAGGGITDQAAIEIDIANKMARIKRRLVQAGMPAGTPIMIGEYGFPQEAPYWPVTLDPVGMMNAVLTNAESLGFEGVIYWQGLSNEEFAPGQPRGFNLWYRNGDEPTVGALNSLGEAYEALLTPPAPQPSADALTTNEYSIEFAGTNGYARVGAGGSVPTDMDVDPEADSYSVHVWVKTQEIVPYQFCIFSRALAGAGDVGMLLGVNTNGKPYLIVGGVTLNATTAINDGDWHSVHIWVSDTKFGIGVDGVTQESGEVGALNSTADYLIGGSRYNNNSDDSFVMMGSIQNLTWWNRRLNELDFAQLHNGGEPVDPTTHYRASSLGHWWSIGEGDSIPTLIDHVGSSNATLVNTPNVRLIKQSPVFTPSSLTTFPHDNNCDMHFDATSWNGSGDWTDGVTGYIGVKQSSPVRTETSQFAGHYQTNNGGWFRVANAAQHRITPTTVTSYRLRMYTGALDGTGGFFFGYDATVYGKSSVHAYNYFFDKDVALRLRKSDDSGDYMAAESHASQHVNKYIDIVITVDMTLPRIRVYVNGALVVEDTTTDGVFASHTDAPLGLMGIAYSDVGGFVSTASGQKMMEIARYPGHEFTAAQVAVMSAEFNALKGYI